MKQLKNFPYYCLGSSTPKVRAGALVSYSHRYVKKSIHLFRDPFENIISRFHHRMARFPPKGDVNLTDRQHFIEYCRTDRVMSPLINSLVFKLPGNLSQQEWNAFSRVPCHDDFFRYIIWHNMVFFTTRAMKLENMNFHYESYGEYNSTEFNQASDALLDFLEYSRRAPPAFFRRRNYVDYFNPKQKQAVFRALKAMSTNDTWTAIKRYFTVQIQKESSPGQE